MGGSLALRFGNINAKIPPVTRATEGIHAEGRPKGDQADIPFVINRNRFGKGQHQVLEAALAYGRMGWRIFPTHGAVESPDGRLVCTCKKSNCLSPAKHPRTKNGFRDATNDPEQIRKWFARWPDSNIGIATGSGLVVIDIDGAAGAAEFKELVAAHGPPPATLVSQTGNGLHAIYQLRADSPEVRSSARGKVHIRGEGGFIIGPPSRHITGRTYQWIRKNPIAILPDWLRQWSQGYDIANKSGSRALSDVLGPVPAYLSGQNVRDISAQAAESLKAVYSPSEHARVASALQSIPVKGSNYDDFLRVGMALKELDWQRSDGTDIGYELWDAWCSQSEHHNPAGLEFKWNSFRRNGVSVGSVFHMARSHGWTGGAPEPLASPPVSEAFKGLNGSANGAHALPAAFLAATQGAIIWPDVNEQGLPKSTCTNTTVAVQHLGIDCRKDVFHEKMMVAGEPINAWAGELSDDVVQMLRKTIRYKFGFDPKVENTRDACTQLCLARQFNPVCDYLDSLRWDGCPRLDTWLSRYMGAPDTELNRAIGALVLIAAARRARDPGIKFDEIVVFESVEGRGKSTAIEILAGAENFSDQNILGMSGKEQQEAMTGIWLYEIADLTGMKKTDVEHIKSFASRKVDRARPAYGRYRVDRKRSTVFFATTNDDEYLQSQTGNRRFWPVITGRIDLEALRADRDQLWAEAALRESKGESIRLPERLWAAAGDEQNQRTESDQWSAAIHNYLNMPDKIKNDVSITDALVDNQFLQIESGRVGRREQMRAGAILRRLGFTKYRKRLSGNAFEYRYRRPD